MAYEKVGWKDYPDTSTPTNATNLNKMDNQIAINAADITTIIEALDEKADSSSLAGVAKSGSYNDLSNKPTIPTNTNQLTNGAGFISAITKAMVTNALGYTPPTQDTNTWRPVQNNLTSTSTTDSLSAAQGKALNDRLGGATLKLLSVNSNSSITFTFPTFGYVLCGRGEGFLIASYWQNGFKPMASNLMSGSCSNKTVTINNNQGNQAYVLAIMF